MATVASPAGIPLPDTSNPDTSGSSTIVAPPIVRPPHGAEFQPETVDDSVQTLGNETLERTILLSDARVIEI